MSSNSGLVKDVLTLLYLFDENLETNSVNQYELKKVKEIQNKSQEYLNQLMVMFYEKYNHQKGFQFLFNVLYVD